MDKIHLTSLPIDTYGEVVNLNCNGMIRRRLLDLGIVKGTKIVPILKSPSGDPTAFSIRGSVIALRKEDANLIDVIKLDVSEIEDFDVHMCKLLHNIVRIKVN